MPSVRPFCSIVDTPGIHRLQPVRTASTEAALRRDVGLIVQVESEKEVKDSEWREEIKRHS